MKTYYKAILSVMVIFPLLLSVFATSVGAVTTTSDFSNNYDFSLGYNFNNSDSTSTFGSTNQSGQVVTVVNESFTECVLQASSNLVTIGESITLNWNTVGFDTITIDGNLVSGSSGSKVISNLQQSTSFTLQAISSNGSTCLQTVHVTCLPPEEPKKCELDVHKTVNKTSAIPGDELTYTITVKNTGDAACTGGGVKIEDVVDPNLTYLRHQLSSNISAGYGTSPVYTASDRTLRFNGHDLHPGEVGTITWVGKVSTPTTCGNFEVKNQAKATAVELANYTVWAYSQTVKTQISNSCVVPVKPVCTLTPTTQTIPYGATTTIQWTTAHAHTVTLSDFGAVAVSGTKITPALFATTAYTLKAVGDGGEVNCIATVAVEKPEVVRAPKCDAFTATPGTITVGGNSTLAWRTTDATKVYINNGIGEVSATGSIGVSPLATITYVLTVVGVNNQTVTCTVPVTVTPKPLPLCESFTVTPSTLPAGGGSVVLNWKVTQASHATITPMIGAVSLVGSKSVTVTESTQFVLTAINNGDQVQCVAPVVVAGIEPPFTCSDNVSFTAARDSITRGQSTTLSWSTSGVDTVSISGINATNLSGTQSVSPTTNATYVLTAKKGTKSIDCPVTVRVTTSGGGGGGGGVTPRCELTASTNRISAGDSVRLTWRTSGANEVVLTDDRGMSLFTTADYLANDKTEHFNRSFTVKPTRTTTYTLLAARGSSDRECTVVVRVDSPIVVLETRTQEPLIAGISLTQVPYTGFEAGPFLTFMFYALLVLWSLYLTYLLVIRQRMASAVQDDNHIVVTPAEEYIRQAEAVRPDVFVNAVMTAPAKKEQQVLPQNLPIAKPVIGYENQLVEPMLGTHPHQVNDDVVTDLENRAHAQKALFSSDAIRYFIATTTGTVERHTAIDSVIAEAKKSYPLEDGWVVINEMRMKQLCETCADDMVSSAKEPFVPATVPEGAGSLAEAIVTGNIVAAYEMIGNRPMFALADAAADLDGVYRNRKGGDVRVSDMLTKETASLSDEQIKKMITALTGALDGTYSDEASAVKMAIMKAVKEVG